MQAEIAKKAQQWLSEEFDADTRQQVQDLINNDPGGLEDAFYKDLEFGTGGLRGIMGVGTNRINIYTIGKATQGLANYVKNSYSSSTHLKAAIAFDSRNNSPLFARRTAEVLAANGFTVYLFDELRPTPELSFAVRHLECHCGIVITASHNPKEYNGYKVYWNDGAQLVSPHDQNVIAEVQKIDTNAAVLTNFEPDNIKIIGAELDAAYLASIESIVLGSEHAGEVSIVFTSIHGTGIQSVPPALKQLGFSKTTIVEAQQKPDGNFPTVISPNPEEAAALALALEKAEEIGADLVMGTDPDADRVGIAVRNLKGELVLLNGNQIGSLIVYYMLHQSKAKNRLKGNEFVAKTIVTSDLIQDIATSFDVPCHSTLTGFKYIAGLIRELEGKAQFIAGGEESYGYLIGDAVRDKDAVISSVVIAEIAAWAKGENSSFFEKMLDLYLKYGFYKEHLISITKKGKAGAELIQRMMTGFRSEPPSQLGGRKVVQISDYQAGFTKDIATGQNSPIDLPASNVLQFLLEGGSKVTARPSGTEPKIKFYISVKGILDSIENYEQVAAELDEQIAAISKDLQGA